MNIKSKPPTLEDQAIAAFEASRNAHRTFEAMMAQVEAGSLNIEQIKGFFDMVQTRDKEWLDREAQLRQWSNRQGEDFEDDLSGADARARDVALRYLEEMIQFSRSELHEEKELFKLTPHEEKSDKPSQGRYQRFQKADR